MKKGWDVTQESFDTLLKWLDDDRDEAGRKYQAIRIRLIKIFTCRGCSDPEGLADETINRVIAKVPELVQKYQGDPALYFYGVCQKVQLEDARNPRRKGVEFSLGDQPVSVPIDSDDDDRIQYECLQRCLEELSSENRRLVLGYYQDDKRAKIDHRKAMATEMGIALNALRIRAHRIRREVKKCVLLCMAAAPAN